MGDFSKNALAALDNPDGLSTEKLNELMNLLVLEEISQMQQMRQSKPTFETMLISADDSYSTDDILSTISDFSDDHDAGYAQHQDDLGSVVRDIYTKHPHITLSPEVWSGVVNVDDNHRVSDAVGLDVHELAGTKQSIDYNRQAVYVSPEKQEEKERTKEDLSREPVPVKNAVRESMEPFFAQHDRDIETGARLSKNHTSAKPARKESNDYGLEL